MAIGRVPGATGIQPSIVDAKGDLIAATAADSVSRLAVGTNNQVLTADSAEATGLKYANGSRATLTTTGDLLYASAANTPARLAIGSTDQVLKVSGGIPAWGAAPSPTAQAVSVKTTSATATVSGAYTNIAFQDEYFDTDAFHDNSTNNSRLTVPTGLGGKYFVCATLFFSSGAAATNPILRLSKNNAAETRWGINYIVASDRIAVSATGVFTLNATDYMEAQIYQNTGANRNVDAADGQGHFSMYRIGA